MTRMLTILSLVALPLVGCDHDGGSGPGFMSGMGMGSGVTNATSGYGFDENFEATYGTVPAAREHSRAERRRGAATKRA